MESRVAQCNSIKNGYATRARDMHLPLPSTRRAAAAAANAKTISHGPERNGIL